MKPREFRDIRRALGFTQASIAKHLGVGRKKINRWENHHVKIPLRAEILMILMAEYSQLDDEGKEVVINRLPGLKPLVDNLPDYDGFYKLSSLKIGGE